MYNTHCLARRDANIIDTADFDRPSYPQLYVYIFFFLVIFVSYYFEVHLVSKQSIIRQTSGS